MGASFAGTGVELDEQYEVTVLSDLDFEEDEVTELVEVSQSDVYASDSSSDPISFMSSLFRAL